jgi:hypothetical protein
MRGRVSRKPIRVSTYYKLGRTQAELDFVNVDIHGDTCMFVDPRALRQLQTDWTDECVSLLQNFFSTVLEYIRQDREVESKALLEVLHEPNETHLGLSKGQAQGSGLGEWLASEVHVSLSESAAVRTGLLRDLEDKLY